MPKARTDTAAGLSRARGYYTGVELVDGAVTDQARKAYPFNIPALQRMGTLAFDSRVTIIVGENGSGKSTLIEAIAVAAGFNAEGGSKNFNFATRRTESTLHRAIKLVRGARRERDGYFLRAECMYNVATELERLDTLDVPVPKLTKSYGDTSLHHQSHGESFFALVSNRLGDDSFIIMDEPESALSPSRQLYLLSQMHRLVEKQRCQILLSTHSPILMAYPGALLYRMSSIGIERVKFDETEHFTLTRDYLGDYKAYLRNLFTPIDARWNGNRASDKTQGRD